MNWEANEFGRREDAPSPSLANEACEPSPGALLKALKSLLVVIENLPGDTQLSVMDALAVISAKRVIARAEDRQ